MTKISTDIIEKLDSSHTDYLLVTFDEEIENKETMDINLLMNENFDTDDVANFGIMVGILLKSFGIRKNKENVEIAMFVYHWLNLLDDSGVKLY